MNDLNWNTYIEFRKAAVCSDCGKKASDAKEGDMWATETQCLECFAKFGNAERRGKPTAEELFNDFNAI